MESDTGQKFLSIDLGHVSGELVLSEQQDGFQVEVYSKADANLTSEKARRIAQNGFRALHLSAQIIPGSTKELCLYAKKRIAGFVTSGFAFDHRFADDEDDSQLAAILHELLESELETTEINQGNFDTIPHIAEFLFTGTSRLEYFATLNKLYFGGKSRDHHVSSWKGVIRALLPANISTTDPSLIYDELLKTRELTESEKIALIKKAISI